jgi:hypothetical protein
VLLPRIAHVISSDVPLKGPGVTVCDNKAAILLCKEEQRAKHNHIIHHCACDHVASGELQFVYCKSEDNVSDCLTKALTWPMFGDTGFVGLGMCSE